MSNPGRLCLVVLGACGGSPAAPVDVAPSPDAVPSVDAPDARPACADAGVVGDQADCSGAACATVAIANDPISLGPGTFHGFADPSLAHDPSVSGRVWLAYSWPGVRTAQATDGNTVDVAVVTTHLARSDDQGETFAAVGELWNAPATDDPEGSGEHGYMASETSSITSMTSGGTTTWYGTHLHYFLRPIAGYNPKYGTGWTVRVTAAASPMALASSPEAVLGVSTTAAVYQAVHLDEIAGLPTEHCAMLNNPTLFAQSGTLYLIVECLAFTGTTLDHVNTTTQVFATTPAGLPASWTWHHVGVIGDYSLAQQLGDDTIQQPDVSRAADGTLLFVTSRAHDAAPGVIGDIADGCVAIELASIDPPVLHRDCAGRPVIRAEASGAGVGACTHDAASLTGVMVVHQGATGGSWSLHASGLRP